MFSCKGNHILLVLHKGPDLDCLAACAVVNDCLRQVNKDNKRIFILDAGNKINFFYQPLEKMATIITEEEIPPETSVILLDHHDREFSTLTNWKNEHIKEFLIFDHHYTVKSLEEEVIPNVEVKKYIDTSKTSTCELLFDLLKTGMNAFKYTITPEIATYLYVGIYSDCMRFFLPVKVDIHKKIVELAERYKAKIDEHAKYAASKTIYYSKIFSDWWKNHVQTYEGNKGIALLRIPNAEWVRVTNAHMKPTAFIYDVLMSRGINHVVAIFQVTSKLWTLKICSRYEGVVESVFKKAFKPRLHTCKAFYYKAIKDMENNTIKKIIEWEENNKL